MQKQRAFPIIGVRVPAPDAHAFPKRSKTICLRVDPSLYDGLMELANFAYMTVSSYCMRVFWAHVGGQRLLCNQRNHGGRA
jgi:hypothetical protein